MLFKSLLLSFIFIYQSTAQEQISENVTSSYAFFSQTKPGVLSRVCKNCAIRRMDKQLNLNPYPQVTLIELDNSGINIISENTFGIFTNLRDLSLKNNNITEVSYMKHGNLQLERLWLDGNGFTTLPKSLCKEDPMELYFTHNKIEALEFNCTYSRIQLLDLSFNQIKYIDLANLFKGFANLKELRLSNNDVSAMNTRNTALPKLEILNLDHNRIYDIGDIQFSFAPNLRVLNLQWNAIQNFSSSSLEYNPNLEVVDLSRNLISHFNFDSPINTKIVSLDLSYNQISELRSFRGFDRLKKFNISYNVIRNVNTAGFLPLRDIKELDLSNNYIVEIDLRPLDHLKDYLLVDLRGNVLNCKTIGHLKEDHTKKYSFDNIPCKNTELTVASIASPRDIANISFCTQLEAMMTKICNR